MTIKKIYELQDIGKGVINTLTEDNLLQIFDLINTPNLQEVLIAGSSLIEDNTVFIDAGKYFTVRAGASLYGFTISDITPSTTASNISIGNLNTAQESAERGFNWYSNKTGFNDIELNKGLEYEGDYEANFTNRSLITKQFFDSNVPTVDGSETKITAGSNISVSGGGTTASPYIISNTQTVDGSETKVNAGSGISVSGSGTTGSPYVITNSHDGSETKINSGVTTVVTGNGTSATPYVIETVNLQKPITGDYTLTASDNNYSIKVDNGSTPITITVPSGLPENFFAGFTQKGTADVTFIGSGTTITNPIGLKIKGQGYCVGLEQIGTTNSYDLMADTKA